MALFSGLQNAIFGNNRKEDARLRMALDAIQGIRVPTVEELQVQLEQLVQQGVITPEMAQTVLQAPSVFEEMQLDPTARAAQLDALRGLQDVYQQGGLTAIDRARIADIQEDIGTTNRGAQQAILQNASERGIYGSGLELANRLQAQQASATRGARQGLDVAAEAQKRALEAMMQSGNLAGQVYGQDYQKAADKARAADEINRFNAANRQQQANLNTQARNQAQMLNLGERQRIADTNTKAINQNRVRNADLIQNRFDNQMRKAQALVNPAQAYAESARRQQDKEEEFTGGLINSAIQSGSYLMSDEREKTDVSDAGNDLDALMAKIDPTKFRYRNPEKDGAAPGEQVGVMAQDLEKHPIGRSMVVDTDEGKKIDPMRALSVIMAELANLNEKVGSKNG
jgi:hypothetical protein